MHIYITRKEYGDTVANYGCNKAIFDNTRNKKILFTVRFDYQWVVFFSGFQQKYK